MLVMRRVDSGKIVRLDMIESIRKELMKEQRIEHVTARAAYVKINDLIQAECVHCP